jgi:hypothetical protein
MRKLVISLLITLLVVASSKQTSVILPPGASTCNTDFRSLSWKWSFSLGLATPIPGDIKIADDQARFINVVRQLLDGGNRLYIQVLNNGQLVFRQFFEQNANARAHVYIIGTKGPQTSDQLVRIVSIYQLLSAQFPNRRIEVGLGQTFEDADEDPLEWLIVLKTLFKQGKSAVITILVNGKVVVKEDSGAAGQWGPSFKIINNGKEKFHIDIFRRITQIIEEDEDISVYTIGEDQFSDKAKWYVDLLALLKQNKQVDISVTVTGQIVVRASWRQTGKPGIRIITDSRRVQKSSIQWRVLSKLTWWFNSSKVIEVYRKQSTPVTPSIQVFSEKGFWYITLLKLLKEKKQVDISVDEDGDIQVIESKTQTGKGGYRIITDISKISNKQSAQYLILFRLTNFISTHQKQIDEYITVTTTTVTTTTKQISGVEAFLNSLAVLIAAKKQFTISITEEGQYHVIENSTKVGSDAFFEVVYSTKNASSAQKAAWERLYDALETRKDIIKFDRTKKVVDDPFNAIIKTTTTQTVTTTVKKGSN